MNCNNNNGISYIRFFTIRHLERSQWGQLNSKATLKTYTDFESQSSHLNTVVRLVKTIKICNYKIITFQEKKIVETGYMTATCVVIAILD